ncbi:single-stranded DNA-binding protein [Clostridium peptidivorans]|uniref:single-stranded DNA-binding protein n=1 Tax=Clostridium peptidivorans TaxID=100174 RepID=UPI000BE376D1|nr:single-stranded DNA-binding protein [Clostridium peptidivorans]
MNKVILIGRLTKDPELKFTPGNGTAVATFTLAVDRRFSKDGKKETDFIPVVVWGKQAEATAQYVGKGKLIGVSGRIQTRNYEAKDGTKRYVTEIVSEEVQFIEWTTNKQEISEYPDDLTPVDDGEIPF